MCLRRFLHELSVCAQPLTFSLVRLPVCLLAQLSTGPHLLAYSAAQKPTSIAGRMGAFDDPHTQPISTNVLQCRYRVLCDERLQDPW
jgi:hypothetical protein